MGKITIISPKGIEHSLQKPNKLRVAAYVRVSTDSTEQLQSFNAQVEHYKGFINANPKWELVGVYADEGISGTKIKNRTELLRLLSDCESGKIDFIITKSISRFARNTTDCLEIVRRLGELSVAILFEKENINTKTTDSELILAILSSLAAEESKSISQNNKWSIKNRFENGTYKLAVLPYGYEYNGGTIIPNTVQAKIVKRIFSEVLFGSGIRAVAMHLNADKIKPIRGQKWTDSSIRGILQNEKYIGDVVYQKTYTDDNFIRHANKGEKDKYYLKNNHMAIISKEEFEGAARIIAQRGKEKGIGENVEKYQNRYSFSGMIVCGECGGTFKRRIHLPNKAGKYVAWCCNNHIDSNGKDCTMLFIRDESIKSAFVVMMNKLYSNRNQILKPLLQALKQMDSTGESVKIEGIDKKIDEISKQEQSLMGLYTKNILELVRFHEKQNSLESELARLRDKKRILQGAVQDEKTVIIKTEELYKYLNKNGGILETFNDALFLRFVSRIVVISPTKIGFKLKNGLYLRERIVR